MATQIAERRADPVTVFRQTLARPEMREQIKMALPSHIPVERFERVSLTAVQQNPDLLNKVDRRSLFGALVKAAQDGLLPDGYEGAIVPFKGKAQWMPMVRGIMKKVRNSGEIANWDAVAVFEKDKFQRLLGDDMRIFHEPFDEGDPGQVTGAYSIVTFKDGTKSKDYMPRWRIEKAREQNPIGKNSLMWTKFYDEGAIKTVIRHHSKRLPMSTDIEAIFERDETVTPPGGFAPQLVEGEEPRDRLGALEQRIDADEQADNEIEGDPETGEIVDEEPVGAAPDDDCVEELDDDNRDAFGLDPLPERDEAPAEEADAESPTDAKLREIRERIEAASTPAALKKVDSDWVKASAAYDDDTQKAVNAELTAKTKALREAEKGE